MAFIDIYCHSEYSGLRKMSSSINLALTDELREFIDRNCGDGTLFATPSEFLRSLLREKKERLEAAEMRAAILEGYRDLIEGRVVEFKGDVRATLREAARRDKQGWK
jgi:antitoxin ParD1/3/4